MNERSRTVAITGARGYVGSLLRRAFTDEGWRVISLVRSASLSEGDAPHYDLAHAPSPAILDGIDTLVHCAWDLSITRPGDIWRVNVGGTAALLRLARDVGVRRVIFVSSMSAYEGTGQLYGRSKLECENIAVGFGHAVVRLGLVYGPSLGGMAESLCRMTRLPITPLPAAQSYQYTVHEDDVAAAVLLLAAVQEIPLVPLGIAHPEPVQFSHLVSAIGQAYGRSPHLLRIPWRAAYRTLRAAEVMGLSLSFRADSLLGLARSANEVPNQDQTRDLGLSFRPFAP